MIRPKRMSVMHKRGTQPTAINMHACGWKVNATFPRVSSGGQRSLSNTVQVHKSQVTGLLSRGNRTMGTYL